MFGDVVRARAKRASHLLALPCSLPFNVRTHIYSSERTHPAQTTWALARSSLCLLCPVPLRSTFALTFTLARFLPLAHVRFALRYELRNQVQDSFDEREKAYKEERERLKREHDDEELEKAKKKLAAKEAAREARAKK